MLKQTTRNIALYLVIYFTCFAVVAKSNTGELSVPAEFSYELLVPGKFSQIVRPSSVFYDHQLDECFVADPGNNRIVVFDRNGNFVFEFSGTSHFSSPSDLAVDCDGLIWVLSSSLSGRHISVFDFDGFYLRTIDLPTEINGTKTYFSSFDLDNEKNIYLIERYSTQVVVLDSQGNLKSRFPILSEYSSKEREEETFGRLRVQNDLLLIPCGVSAVVYLYSLNGDLIRGIGYKGNIVGSLSFPVGAVMTKDSLILVLDKHRTNVVCYDISGKFKGEFGGRGINPGWFYHPTLLEANNNNQVYIGQIFNSKVQACRIPEFICPDKTGGVQE